jgi:hypothetical protein
MRKGRPAKPKPVSLPHIGLIEVDNPLFGSKHATDDVTSRRIITGYNHRESFIGFLYGKRKITDAERMAGDKVRKAFETMGGAGAQAIDYSRAKVDGGKIADPISVRQLEAGSVLRDCHKTLGAAGHDLVIKLCGECQWPKDLTRDERKQDYLSMRLRECLETLSVHWGYASREARIRVA